ncbi:NADH dehydrogenase [ubiquinone] 1 alpha subcomplex assembly factor 2 [Phlebotomus argentipes]|uniref:NADH dehydrogenase [ubiquinone] 1 alpha subcomplex assembly factor 2 n=1 Tax=Phlebotomus argentipes TaxID=94469 RepID=UPI002892BAD2|nr:NADH dehydrogenase [ubiquinone] 1 alpha subcomplex assembly factor 2 [Phlebotomus argentipes]
MSKGKERDIVKIIFQNFLKSIRPRKFKGELIGEDTFGNKFYEIAADPVNGRRKRARYFEPMEKEAFDQEMSAEWEAWLRGRRQEAPTPEELLQNLAIAQIKQRNAALVEESRGKGKDVQLLNNEEKGMRSFPSYGDEYEFSAGVSPPKDKK